MTTELGTALRAAREARGLTQADVAKALKVSRAAVGQWEAGTTHPSTSNLLQISSLLNVTVTSLTGNVVHVRPGAPEQPSAIAPAAEEFSRSESSPPVKTSMPLDVPVYGVAVGGEDADFSFNGETADYARRPPGIAKAKGVYAVHVAGVSMYPRFEEGELVYVNSSRAPSIGDYVILELYPEEGERTGKGYIKKLRARTPTRIICEQFNPPLELEFPREKVKSLHRVIPWTELLGS